MFDERVRILVDKLLEEENRKLGEKFESLIKAEAERQVAIRLTPHDIEKINYAHRDTIGLVYCNEVSPWSSIIIGSIAAFNFSYISAFTMSNNVSE